MCAGSHGVTAAFKRYEAGERIICTVRAAPFTLANTNNFPLTFGMEGDADVHGGD